MIRGIRLHLRRRNPERKVFVAFWCGGSKINPELLKSSMFQRAFMADGSSNGSTWENLVVAAWLADSTLVTCNVIVSALLIKKSKWGRSERIENVFLRFSLSSRLSNTVRCFSVMRCCICRLFDVVGVGFIFIILRCKRRRLT